MKVGNRFLEVSTQPKFAEPKARGVLDPVKRPVFACSCTILFDIWRRPGGVAGESVPLEAPPKPPPRLRRRSLEESSMFPEAPKKHHKKKWFRTPFFKPF